jgi:hypothetical protein
VKPRPPVIVRLGPERTDEQVALGYLLESLDRLPSVFRRLRFLVALRDLYATTPPARRAAELLELFTDVDAAHAQVQALVRTTDLARTVTVVRA